MSVGSASLASGIINAQAGALQTQIATAILKSNADAEKSAVETLLGIAQPDNAPAATAPGVGGNLDVSV